MSAADDMECEVCTLVKTECVCKDCECSTCTGGNCRCQADHDDRLIEDLVVKSSTPNLGALMRQGKKSGLIKPVPTYGG